MVSLAPNTVLCKLVVRLGIGVVSIVYITTTHKALGALLTAVTVKTDLQSTVVEKYLQFHSFYTMTMLIVRSLVVHLTPIPCLPKSSQASTPSVVSGFLLVRLCALAHHLEVCASNGSA